MALSLLAAGLISGKLMAVPPSRYPFVRDEGDLGMNPMNRWVGLFLDKLIGKDFETGLVNLKKLVEK